MSARFSKPATCRTICLLVLSALCVHTGCGYGKVSPQAYECAKALYAITNRQAADRLPEVETQISESLSKGELAAQEADWLLDIIKDAENERWEAAAKAARRLMEDQVER